MRRLRGFLALVHDAVDRTTELVAEGHESSARSVMRVLGAVQPLAEPARAVDEVRRRSTEGGLGTIRAFNRAIETVTDAGLDVAEFALDRRAEPRRAVLPVPMRSDTTRTIRWLGDAALGVVNGAIGDRLHDRDNGLELGMSMRHGDVYLELDGEAIALPIPDARAKVAVFVHGLATTEWCWSLESEAYHGDPAASFGSLLAADLDYTPIFVRYNSGRHVSENGRLLAEQLQRLVERYPVEVEEIVLIGHSMGGLVIRSACHYGQDEGASWVDEVRHVFCLGTPHRGADLARLGHVAAVLLDAIDHPGTRIPGRLLKGRSAGIRDLRQGLLVDEDWLGRDPDALREEAAREIPLLGDVTYHFISATVTEEREHPLGRLVGDLLVRTTSAEGPHLRTRSFPIATSHYGGVLHHQLQNHPAVYRLIREACAGASLAGADFAS